MIVRSFPAQQEYKNFDGSEFIEIQFCKLPSNTKIKKIVAVNNINHWQDDSLYIHAHDIDEFIEKYGHIFNCGIYNNLKNGAIDIFGINYYSPLLIDSIIEKLSENKSSDCDLIIEWFKKSKEYNGFYILGL